ncbi:citrate transporter [Campylobacter sp. faydin G-105]|uniref:citrate transporter n=1 Tax=Campylobacter anatolicus TaxID=2829105 RepID=UPI001B93F0F6|nr:citrate transporter [Campylobacter anatolicus]MBR8462117.1 citrate transporter [Campylobacter anatolicus]
MLVAAQCVMVLTLLLMISGKTPLYTTAIVGSAISALVAGLPIIGPKDAISLTSLINSGLNPVIADMTGILMFIGVMQASGFMDSIIRAIVRLGNKLGGGGGVAVAGGVTAGVIGMLTGFTQPAITAVITGTASMKLGVDPHRSAGIHGHAGILGNYGGFTHPTQVAVIAVTNIGFGIINVIGVLVSLSVFACAFFRLKKQQKQEGVQILKDDIEKIVKEFEYNEKSIPTFKAFLPFLMLFMGFILGYPVFIVGVASAIFTILLSTINFKNGEQHMLEGVSKIAIPLVATIGFLFMSATIKQIGLAKVIADIFTPMLTYAPLQTMLIVSALAGLITQSNAASVAITIPFLQAALALGTADPLPLAVMAAGGSAMLQYYLTGGPVAALATVIPVISGSNLVKANKFQRPNMLFGLVVLFILSIVFMFL